MGQDFLVHMSRVQGLDNVFTSPVNFQNFGHQGNIMNVMYPWQTLYLASLLCRVIGNFGIAIYLYYFLLNVAAMGIAFYSMYAIKRAYVPSVVFALLYTFASYRTDDLVFRSAVGEFIALTFLPLLLLGCYKIFMDNYNQYYILTIGMVLLLGTHLLSVAMSTFFIGIGMILCLILKKERKERFFALMKAACLTVLLSLVIVIPIVEQVTFQKLYTPMKFPFQPLSLGKLFKNALLSDLSSHTIGVMVLAGAGLTFFFFRRLRNFDRIIHCFGVILLLGTSDLFPWKLLDNTPVSEIQFVFRLNAFITLFVVYSFSVGIAAYVKKKNIIQIAVLLMALFFVHTVSIGRMYKKEAPTGVNVKTFTTEEAMKQAKNAAHFDYSNVKAKDNFGLLIQHPYFLNGVQMSLEEKITSDSIQVTVDNTTGTSAAFKTPILRYRGQVVLVNDKKVHASLSDLGTTELVIPKGKSTVTIYYRYSTLDYIGMAVSLGTFLIALFYFTRKYLSEQRAMHAIGHRENKESGL